MDRNYHNSNFPPNTDPHLYAVLAVTVGFACVGDYNANEQNSIGNWLILVGQYILTHAAQQQLIEARLENNNLNTNSQKHKNGTGGPFTDNEQGRSNQTQRDEVNFLLDAVSKIEKELNNQYEISINEESDVQKLLKDLVQKDIVVEKLEIKKPSLNDIFIEKVGDK